MLDRNRKDYAQLLTKCKIEKLSEKIYEMLLTFLLLGDKLYYVSTRELRVLTIESKIRCRTVGIGLVEKTKGGGNSGADTEKKSNYLFSRKNIYFNRRTRGLQNRKPYKGYRRFVSHLEKRDERSL